MSYLASYIVGLVFQVIYGLIKVKIEIAWPLYVTILMTVKTPEKELSTLYYYHLHTLV
jgi:hypothetical protein